MTERNCQKCQYSLTASSSQASIKCPRCNTWNDPIQSGGGCNSGGGCSSCAPSHTQTSQSGCCSDNGSGIANKNYLQGFLQKISVLWRGK